MNKKLPNKPSELIRVALDDLRKVERSPLYRVDMGEYHTPNGKCAVCFAGAVMAKSLGTPPSQMAWPETFGAATAKKLEALNALRTGWVESALDELDLKAWNGPMPEGVKSDYRIPAYGKRNRNKFHAAMRKLAKTLERAGF